MIKNGAFFVSIVEHNQIKPSVWDPYSYRANNLGERLAKYVTVSRVKRGRSFGDFSPFSPVEYRHIPKGKYLSFMLEACKVGSQRLPAVGEQKLLLGTMRAYLGNVLVTPKAEWIDMESPLYFPIKSEFVCIVPADDCVYFWWAYLQSSGFLRNLPLGSGGTRPRLHEDALLETPVSVPSLEIRRLVHNDLKTCAELEWKGYTKRTQILDSNELD